MPILRRAVVLQHVSGEGPCRIATVATELGLKVEILRLDQGAAVPAALPDDAALVVMGGPMGVGDLGDRNLPFLAQEVALLGGLIAADRPVLGVCLGAQLIAHAAGARVSPLVAGDPPARLREVGWGAITFQRTPAEERVLNGLDQSEVVLHWHGDTFEPPPGASHLAASLLCPQQMFRIRRRIFGLQFHVEVDADIIASWVRDDAAFVRAAGGAGHGERILADTARFMPRHRQVGHRLIKNIFRELME